MTQWLLHKSLFDKGQLSLTLSFSNMIFADLKMRLVC